MFGRSTNDISEVLMRMQDEARVVCKHNQSQMARQMAEWMSNDRRFDNIPDKHRLARDAMDARSHGRVLDMTPQQQSNANTYFGHIVRQA